MVVIDLLIHLLAISLQSVLVTYESLAASEHSLLCDRCCTFWQNVCLLSANPLPQPISHATVVLFGVSFLLVGGETDNESSLSTIYQYNSDEDSWSLLDVRMNEGQINVIAMLVDSELFGMK
jgi:N-acetylneuraminic acid mutarotase